MTHGEQTERGALPLAQAAARLGLTPDALRMRLRRGTARGFKREGRLFVYLSERAGERAEPARASAERPRSDSERSESAGAARAQRETETGPGGVRGESLSVVIEFQKIELSRVLRENRQLNQRVDQLLEELKHLRQMQQREQVLRQQEQVLRERLQGLLDRLAERLALPAPAPSAPAPREPQTQPKPGDTDSPAGPAVAEPSGERPVPPAADRRPQSPATSEARPEPPATAAAPSRSEVETAALAEILRDVGRSLRDLEDSAERPREPARSEGGAFGGERRQAGSEPRSAWPFDLVEESAGGTGLEDISAAEQASLLEILGDATSEEERRTAARIMRRLFRGRAARPREPGDE